MAGDIIKLDHTSSELFKDLYTSAFIKVLRRFIAKRGPEKCIYSDNGSNFVGTERIFKDTFLKNDDPEIHKYLSQHEIVWSFNPPNASNTRGIWKRMIRSVRKILLSAMPKTTLTDDDWHTALAKVEAVVNFRPLTDLTPEGQLTTPGSITKTFPDKSGFIRSVTSNSKLCLVLPATHKDLVKPNL